MSIIFIIFYLYSNKYLHFYASKGLKLVTGMRTDIMILISKHNIIKLIEICNKFGKLKKIFLIIEIFVLLLSFYN